MVENFGKIDHSIHPEKNNYIQMGGVCKGEIICKQDSMWEIIVDVNYTFFADDENYKEVVLCIEYADKFFCENRTPVNSIINNIKLTSILTMKAEDVLNFKLVCIKNNLNKVNHSVNISKIQCLMKKI